MGQHVKDQVYHGPPPHSRLRRLKQLAYILQHSNQRPEKYITRANPSVCVGRNVVLRGICDLLVEYL